MRRKKISMVFQHFALMPHRTVLDNAAYALEVQGVPRAEREARAMRVLEMVGLGGWADKLPSELSGGMQQLVGLASSSTPAMLAELKAALDKGENIAVTLWRPHWAYDAFPIKDLKDPKGTLGTAESIHTIARSGFATDYPDLTRWIKGFKMDSTMLYSLENALYNSGADSSSYEAIVKTWMAANQTYVDSLTK